MITAESNGMASARDERWLRRHSLGDVVHCRVNKMLKDFRHGMLNFGSKKSDCKETAKFYTTVDSSYVQGLRPTQHWYDDPPYESDLDEIGPCSLRNPKTSISMPYVETSCRFSNGTCLRGGECQPPSSWIYSGDNVIMTRTAGDIQVARDQIRPKSTDSRRFSDSAGLRTSNASVETSASSKRDSLESPKDEQEGSVSPVQGRKKNKVNSICEEASASSDYEEQEDCERKADRRLSRELSGRASSFVGRVKGFGNDVKKKISKLRPNRTASESEVTDGTNNVEATIATSASSVESLPSGSGSSAPALTTSSSNRSSTSIEEEVPAYTGPFIGKARALVDYTPSPYDKDALKFKKGDIIDIITMSQTGSWTGMLNNRVGHFKFINVEPLPEPKPRPRRSLLPRRRNSKRGKPKSVEELLQRINLEEHISVFVLNGYEHLDLFKELEEEDLDYLGITDPEHRAKILTAVELLHDYDSPDSPEADEELTTDGELYPDHSDASKLSGDSAMVQKPSHSPRDSGCYASNENLPHRESLQRGPSQAGSGDISQAESGIHSSDGMDFLTPAPPNNLDGREMLSGGTMATEKRLFYDSSAVPEGNTVIVTRAIIENVSKHSYQPNIMPTSSVLQCTDADGMVNHLDGVNKTDEKSDTKTLTELETTTRTVDSPARTVNNCSTKADVCSMNKRDHSPASDYQLSSLSRYCMDPGSDVITVHQSPSSSPPLRREVICQTLRSQNSPLSHGNAKSLRMNSVGLPLAGTHQAQSEMNSNSKSSTIPRKLGPPSKIKIPHMSAALGNKKLIAFKEPSGLLKKGRGKGTTQATLHPAPSSLDTKLEQKLADEAIDLTQEPYTDKMGFCGIPPALVQRYSEENKCDVKEAADALDHLRISYLQQIGRQGVPNDFLADSCFCPMQEADYLSLESWLKSVGLPMYTESLCCAGHTHLADVVRLKEVDLRACGISNPSHLRRLLNEIEALNIHLQKFAC